METIVALAILAVIFVAIVMSISGIVAEIGRRDGIVAPRDRIIWTQRGPVNGSGQTKRRYL